MTNDDSLDRAFSALADPTRRALLTKLGHGEAVSVSELARPFEMSLPAIMKHIAVLEAAGLVERQKTGRTVHCRLRPDQMQAAIDWLERTRAFWESRLESLAEYVEAQERPDPSKKQRKETNK